MYCGRKDTLPVYFSIRATKHYESVTSPQHGCATKAPRPRDAGSRVRKPYGILKISSDRRSGVGVRKPFRMGTARDHARVVLGDPPQSLPPPGKRKLHPK
ncbi:hypothetical protein SPHINGO391_480013 [Sphingomonas aurantiaca]|uniref:Uncharacterized protein n=1 Tax=Sphingomonas aurantiaca TaxID=185949 RepID=A0A5E8A2W1_9SPHN|nr:hypothetical protein SPHINGO391_480013 [Sphingomonas aurantiaca]